MGEEVQSQKVCCCNARSWARVIGWLDIISSVIGLLVIILFLSGVIVPEENEAPPWSGIFAGTFASVPFMEVVLLTGLCLLTFAGGIVLVKGVNQGSSSKLKCWLIIEGIFVAFDIPSIILELVTSAYREAGGTFISILITLFCMWIVNVHRKELMNPFARTRLPV